MSIVDRYGINTRIKDYDMPWYEQIFAIVCACLDLFITPFYFQYAWNYIMPDIFDVKRINYVHALLVKVLFVLCFFSPCSAGIVDRENSQRILHYVNCVYDKLASIDMRFESFVNKRRIPVADNLGMV